MERPEYPFLPKTANETSNLDPTFQRAVQRLHYLTVYSRWIVVSLLWLSVGALSIWGMRDEISLWLEHFTWIAVLYGLRYNPLPTLGLCLCISMTLSVLIWQSRNILLGMPRAEKHRLEVQVLRIRAAGQTHPLWKWVGCEKKEF